MLELDARSKRGSPNDHALSLAAIFLHPSVCEFFLKTGAYSFSRFEVGFKPELRLILRRLFQRFDRSVPKLVGHELSIRRALGKTSKT